MQENDKNKNKQIFKNLLPIMNLLKIQRDFTANDYEFLKKGGEKMIISCSTITPGFESRCIQIAYT